jgi:hypothetical protein
VDIHLMRNIAVGGGLVHFIFRATLTWAKALAIIGKKIGYW